MARSSKKKQKSASSYPVREPSRAEELASALKTLKRLGFKPVSWECKVFGQTIWIEEMYDKSPRFSVSCSEVDERRATASALKATIHEVAQEGRLAKARRR